ncbi:MAG: dipeptide epimerase [Gammaproteobacteria bacterium]|nr:dipeptide epimerase [Gammaproteobacteria bacterium]
MRTLSVNQESWPLRQQFTISRGSKYAADVIYVEVQQRGAIGRGECVPYARYGDTLDSVLQQIDAVRAELCEGLSRDALQQRLPPGAARNALDCALWDLQAKLTGQPVWKLAGLSKPQPVETAYTLSLDSVSNMAAMALEHADKPLLKLKLDSHNPSECVRAVRSSAPDARIIVDANEAWSLDQLRHILPELAKLNVELIEQPLTASEDSLLEAIEHAVALCADESFHHSGDIGTVRNRYNVVNIKLDKTGGLTEAIQCRRAALAAGLDVMIGCMVGTSLAMAPAMLIAHGARVVDLDGPLLLNQDRKPSLVYRNGKLEPPSPMLWG